MNKPAATPVSADIEAFTRRIEAMSRQHQEMALAICAVCLARKTGMLSEMHPRPHSLWTWVQEQVAALFDLHPTSDTRARGTDQAIVIDSRDIDPHHGEVIDG